MNLRRIRTSWPLLALLLSSLALTACQTDATGGGAVAGGEAPVPAGESPTSRAPIPQGDPRDPRHLRFMRVALRLSEWDAAQAEGNVGQADAIARQIQADVHEAHGDFIAAAHGQLGLEKQYLAVSALGFSRRPDVTQVLVDQLASKDARLASNALIAMKLRSDPNTPIKPLMDLMHPRTHELPRRYAPLAFANVVDSRRRAGRPLSSNESAEAAYRLHALSGAPDADTRLHVAKALGAVATKEAVDTLLVMVRDQNMRVRWSAAAALERTGESRGFPEVVRLLHDVPNESKPVIRDVLGTYAGRLEGRTLSRDEVQRLGTSSANWSRWYSEYAAKRGLHPRQFRDN